jgi:hypothetical protein
MSERAGFVADDERMHRFDPSCGSWNESWYFSWIDLDGGPSGFFRLGVLPNQRRGILWCYVHRDGAWLGTEETRLALDDFELGRGVSYDKWALRFAWRPDPPLRGARFRFAGELRRLTGPEAGSLAPVALDLAAAATTDCFATGTGGDQGSAAFPASRFEQSLAVTGSFTEGNRMVAIRAAGHRDRSWGPRSWRQAFALGDVQSAGGQLYFVGAPQLCGMSFGYLRDASGMRTLHCADGAVAYDDARRTIARSRLGFVASDGGRVDVDLAPIAPSVGFATASTGDPPEHWAYWRTLVEARVSGWEGTARGWFEANRYGIPRE